MTPASSATALVPLSGGGHARVSSGDLQRVSLHSWRAFRNGSRTYAAAVIRGRQVLMHRFVLAVEDEGLPVDHKDGDGLHNTRGNLRVCSPRQNRWNSATKSQSGYHGVTRSGNRWLTKWVSNGEYRYAGCYESAIEAALAYNDAILLERGEFARLNNPPAAEALPTLRARLQEVEEQARRLRRWIEEIEG